MRLMTMSPNAIRAAAAQMRANGELFIPQLGGPPLLVSEWEAREVERARDSSLVRIVEDG